MYYFAEYILLYILSSKIKYFVKKKKENAHEMTNEGCLIVV